MKFRTLSRTLLLATSTIALLAACGGSQAAEPTTPAGADTGEAAPSADAEESQAFDDMAPAAQLKYMKEVVAPQMAKTFQAYDAEHYAEFGCATCHGPGAKEGNFEMPSAALPKLPADLASVFEEKPEVSKFMSEQVVPQMAKLMGEEPINPDTGKGFGCFECHQKQ